MSPEQMRVWVRESRAAQGLPPSITDRATVQAVTEQVAVVLALGLRDGKAGDAQQAA